MSEIAAIFTERAVRRDGGRELPAGPKALRTREAILKAALEMFLTRGYQRTTMADVAESAGISLGAVYQYFRDRSDLVAAIIQMGMQTMTSRVDVRWRVSEGRAGLERVLTNYAAAFEQSPGVVRVWEEVCHVDPDMADLRRSLGRLFQRSLETELRRAQTDGLARPEIDPGQAVTALAGMVDRHCYVTYVFDPPPTGPPPAAETGRLLADLWWHSLGLPRE